MNENDKVLITAEDIKTQPVTQVINKTLAYAREENISVAMWRHPEEQNIQFIMDFSPEGHTPEPLEAKIPGFVFAPYDTNKDTFLIKAELQVDLMTYQVKCKSDYHISAKADAFFAYLKEPGSKIPDNPASFDLPNTDVDEQSFKSLIETSVKKINSGAFLKVVPSRKKEISLENPLNLGENFIRIANHYPSAFVSLVFVPEAGIWMGATPELLLSVEGSTFKTVSLAGTQRYHTETSLANVAWTQKEIEEQALVSRYIINCFKKIRLREYDEIGPKTVVAGNLLHLKTLYQVDMKATNFADLGEVMLKLLHPTSAICGMPLEPAKEFLAEHENFDRSYFSGYLGPANFDGDTALYVNLRCMHIEDTKATFFAGAGVTQDSQPEKEWQETEIKMNTLLKMIR